MYLLDGADYAITLRGELRLFLEGIHHLRLVIVILSLTLDAQPEET